MAAEYEVDRDVPTDADTVFTVAADIEGMREWLPTAMDVEPDGPNQVHVEGNADGHPYSATGLIGVREEQRRIEWGSRDNPDYAGWLQVAALNAGDGGTSTVTLHLSFLGDQPMADSDRHGATAPTEMRQGMAEALQRLERQVIARSSGAANPG